MYQGSVIFIAIVVDVSSTSISPRVGGRFKACRINGPHLWRTFSAKEFLVHVRKTPALLLSNITSHDHCRCSTERSRILQC